MLNQFHPLDFFLFLAAFVYGNLFAIQFPNLQWGGVFIFGLVIFLETINKFLYSSQRLNNRKKSLTRSPINSLCIVTNTMKRGFLLGFFIEAFKVGS